MNTSALIMMVLANIIVAGFTIYYFLKVLRNPGKDEGDFPPGI